MSISVELLHKCLGQMTMVGFSGNYPDEPEVKELIERIQAGRVGGIILHAPNIKNPKQLLELTRAFHQASPKHPLLIAVDQEGGAVQRLSYKNGFQDYPPAQEVATLPVNEVESIYADLADELAFYGINCNLAPVVDININPNSPAIGHFKRSYSSDPEIVCDNASLFIKAHENAGVIPCIKHYPGHGSAVTDTHSEFTDVTLTWQEIEAIPYERFADKSRIMVMSSHVFNQKVDSEFPASLSKRHLTNTLRRQIGFSGIIITDDLQMGALQRYYNNSEIILNAIKAGNDILLFANWFQSGSGIIDTLFRVSFQAIQSNLFAFDQVLQAYQRILHLKEVLQS